MLYVRLICALLFALLSGCSHFGEQKAEEQVILEQAGILEKAVDYLKAGNEAASRDLLEMLVGDSARSGVTDEALFRLSILYLADDDSKSTARIQRLLARLKNEFPRSVWTHQAAPLSHYLMDVKNMRERQRELKILRETNLSLTRDNRELKLSIERIKNLDLELEQKIKR